MFKAFDMSEIEKHRAQYAAEAEQRYGQTGAYRESQARTAKYTKDDWAAIMSQGGRIYQQIAGLMDKGATDPEVQALIAQYRSYISDSFYDCTPEIFRGLGDLYLADERFTKNIDQYGEGLAQFLKEAIGVYCENLE